MLKIKFIFLLILYLSCVKISIAQRQTGKIPLDYTLWYQENNTGDGIGTNEGFVQLSDGDLYAKTFLGWGKIFNSGNAFDAYYEFQNISNVSITSVKVYGSSDTPLSLYAKESASASPILLATFTASTSSPQIVTFTTPINAQYLILNIQNYYTAAEIELYGSYEPATVQSLYPKKNITFSNMLGDNSFIWEFVGAQSDKVDAQKMGYMKAFTQFRDYVDWERLESTEGSYAFDYTASGGWNYDDFYRTCKQEGRTVLMCLKTVPSWFLNKYYPSNVRNTENVPAPYSADKLNPASYLAQAKMGFQIAARYGRNTNIDINLLSGVKTGLVYPNWTNGPSNQRLIGLDLLTYIECDNERDKWWLGRSAYQTGREYAANLSAFYDGHKGILGAGVGVKTADPTMKVVMAGTASTSTDYVRGIIDWCKEFRGYNSDGSVNLCFDIINYHAYANNSGTSQSTSSQRGAAPEVAGIGNYADAFVAIARKYNYEVWVTETGYDVNQGSPLHAPTIANKTPEMVRADWTLRMSLLYARHGVSRVFHYQTYDNGNTATQFASSGMLNSNGTRKPVADYLYQANILLGKYSYKETLNQNPIVDRYEYNGKSLYVLLMPTENNGTSTYTIPGNSAKIYSPVMGTDSMSVRTINGTLTVNVTETPVFILPNNAMPLPVTLVSFSGIPDSHTVKLQWSTAQEVNLYGFSIESCEDGINFQEKGRVLARGGSTLHVYNYNLVTLNDMIYVRLKMLDNDNSFKYSPVLQFNFNDGKEYLVEDNDKIYSITIDENEKPITMYTYDIVGRILSKQPASHKLDSNGSVNNRILVLECESGKKYTKHIY